MRLQEVQEQVDAWIREHGGYWPEWVLLARLTEEVGEVAAALQRLRGYRPYASRADLAEEVGDVLFILAAFANAQGLHLEECLRQALRKYTQRASTG